MARHKHWPTDHPFYERAPWCDLGTKKACDERYKQVQDERLEELAQAVAARTDKRSPDYFKGDKTIFGKRVAAIRGELAAGAGLEPATLRVTTAGSTD